MDGLDGRGGIEGAGRRADRGAGTAGAATWLRGLRFLAGCAAALVFLAALAGIGRNGDGLARAEPDGAWAEIARDVRALCMDAKGALYLAEAGGGAIVAYEDGRQARLSFPDGEIGALAVDARRRVYAALPSSGEIFRAEADGTVRRAVYGLPGPRALALDRDGGLFVALGGAGRVVRIPGPVLEMGLAKGGIAYGP